MAYPFPSWPPHPDRILWGDVETFSELDLTKVGAPKYFAHPSTRITLLSWALGYGPTKLWDCWYPDESDDPQEFVALLKDPRYHMGAFNAPFEMRAFAALLGVDLPPEKYYCTMAHSYVLSFRGDMEDVCGQMGLSEEEGKLKGGKRLVLKFCAPRTPSKSDDSIEWGPHNAFSDWMEYRRYNVRDTEAQRTMFDKVLWPRMDAFDAREHWVWCEYHRIQDRGLPVDERLVENGIGLRAHFREQALTRLEKITGLDNPNSRDQVFEWLNTQGLFRIGNLQAGTIDEVLDVYDRGQGAALSMTPRIAEVLKLYRHNNRRSLDKYISIEQRTWKGTVADHEQYAGASRTRRGAGRGVQTQNIVRGYLRDPDRDADLLSKGAWIELTSRYPDVEPSTLLSWCIRSSFAAPKGYKFNGADLSSIEVATLAYQANCKELLEILAQGLDPYRTLGAKHLGRAPESLTKEERDFYKPPVLGCGYRLSASGRDGSGGLVAYSANLGVHNMTPEVAQQLVTLFRNWFWEIPQLWYWDDEAFPYIVAQPPGTVYERVLPPGIEGVSKQKVERLENFVVSWLPSGRGIYYYDPQLHKEVRQNGSVKWSWSYMGYNSRTYKWERQHSHGGITTEQRNQALARDLLMRESLPLASQAGLDTRLLVHDEQVILSPEEKAEQEQRELIRCLTTRPADWPEVETLHVRAEGETYQYYSKR